jgi:hypothetical protein
MGIASQWVIANSDPAMTEQGYRILEVPLIARYVHDSHHI